MTALRIRLGLELPDLVEGIDTGRETTVQTEDCVVDDGGQREVIKKLSEVDPNIGVSVLSEALIIKAVHLSDLANFVVTTQNGQPVLKTHLQRNE